ncbi:MAG: S-methyl-5-thioribose-1-phosphate isomerase, partial [Pseudomonadota bacterium]
MNIDSTAYRPIWPNDDGQTVSILDQTLFPHEFKTVKLASVEDAARAIRDMLVRGAPLIGATAAYGMALACISDPSDAAINAAGKTLEATRPTAINLRWAIRKVKKELLSLQESDRRKASWELAARICDEDVACNSKIGDYGVELLAAIAGKKKDGAPVNILTHCNAGWL